MPLQITRAMIATIWPQNAGDLTSILVSFSSSTAKVTWMDAEATMNSHIRNAVERMFENI